MKVTQRSQDYLVLSDTPWALSLIMVGMVLVFVFAGLQIIDDGDLWEGAALAVFGGGLCFAFLVGFAQRSQIIFDRQAGRVTRQNRWFFGYRSEDWPLDEVERALVETRSDGEGENHRPALLMRGGGNRRVPLVTVYASGRSAHRAVIAINAWLGVLDSDGEAP